MLHISNELSGAVFSPDDVYRYYLWRFWKRSPHIMLFCMLNPSTANAETNDPTVERCMQRAMSAGFGGMAVVNLFALRCTDPRALRGHPDPVGPRNDIAIRGAAELASLVVCGWGSDRHVSARAPRALELIRAAGRVPHALRRNNDGQPSHPLYLPYSAKPEPIHER
jgi:hypothetical protein